MKCQRLECVSYHCCNKFSVSKQHNFIVSQLLYPGQDTVWPNRIHCSDSHMPNQGVNRDVFLSGGFGDRSTSKLIQVVGQVQFLCAVGLRSLFPLWLSAREVPSLPEDCPHSFSCFPLPSFPFCLPPVAIVNQVLSHIESIQLIFLFPHISTSRQRKCRFLVTVIRLLPPEGYMILSLY